MRLSCLSVSNWWVESKSLCDKSSDFFRFKVNLSGLFVFCRLTLSGTSSSDKYSSFGLEVKENDESRFALLEMNFGTL